ncbi:MAG: hypothetical protein HY802_09910 [Methanobacterium sp.]|nr:hypothetical protein [Methanobacterium sp.]
MISILIVEENASFTIIPGYEVENSLEYSRFYKEEYEQHEGGKYQYPG